MISLLIWKFVEILMCIYLIGFCVEVIFCYVSNILYGIDLLNIDKN